MDTPKCTAICDKGDNFCFTSVHQAPSEKEITLKENKSSPLWFFFFNSRPLYWREVPASVAQLDARPTGDQELRVRPPRVRKHSFVEIDHEIFSTVILSVPLIQEVQLSLFGEWLYTILVTRFED